MGVASLDYRTSTIQGELAGPSTATKNSRSTLDSELLVADASCPHIRALLVGCQAPVLWLQGDQHPFLAISQALAERTLKGSASIQTLHWLSHGSPGQLHIGERSITTAALIVHAQQLKNWGIKDLAIWSCSVGSDVTFISVLEELTGAAVWSSDQPLGRIADGSSHWQLTNALQIKAPSLPINASRQLAWNHQLAAPTLDSSVSPLLAAIDANTGVPSGAVGTLVSALIDSGGSLNNFADADGGSPAIAITGTNLAGGTLNYSTDNGSNWSDVGTVSDASARVLYADSNTRLAFKPATDYIGTISDLITFKAWDRSGSIANGSAAIATAMSLKGTLDTTLELGGPGDDYGVSLSADGNTAFVADGSQGLRIIDVSNPASPTLTGTLKTTDVARGVTLSADGNTAFVADDTSGLQIIDVSTPYPKPFIATFDTSGSALGVTLSADGNTAFVADDTSGLQIIDVSNPASPTLTGTLNTSGNACDVTLSADGDTAFVADYWSGLQIIDISNPASPTLTGTLGTSGQTVDVTLSADGNTAFLADISVGLRIIDVSTPASPTRIATYKWNPRPIAYRVALSADGNTAFATDYAYGGLQMIDVSNPASPTLTANYDIDGVTTDITLSADGNTAFVTNQSEGLRIIDVSAPQYFSSNSDTASIQIADPAPILTSPTPAPILTSPTPAPEPTPEPNPTSEPDTTPESIQTIDGFTQFTDAEDSLTEQIDVKIRMLGGNDYVEITGGIDNFVNGNNGKDTLKVLGGEKSVFLGGVDADTFEVLGGIDNSFNGQLGDDKFVIRDGRLQALGGDDNDTFEVLGAKEGSQVNGNKGKDTITGSAAITYRGGAGDDVIQVSQGEVWGDLGVDVFRGVTGEGYAVIQDYNIGEDIVELAMDGIWSKIESGLIFTDNLGDQIMLLVGISDVDQAKST